MPVTIIYRKKEYEVEAGITVAQALQLLGLLPDSYLAVKNGEVIEKTTILEAGDVVNLVAVMSGGNTVA